MTNIMFVKVKTYRDEKPYLTLQKAWDLFLESHKKHDFKKIASENDVLESGRCVVMFSLRIHQITESILSLKDYYSSIVLYRALIEHIFKCLYICLCSKENDLVAQDYSSVEHMTHEMFLKLKKAKLPERIDSTVSKKAVFREACETGKKFELSKISKKLFEMLAGENGMERALRKALVEYSESSSYVHGGPTAVLNPKDGEKANIDKMSVGFAIGSFSIVINRFSLFHTIDQDDLKSNALEIIKISEDYIRNQWPEFEVDSD